MLIWTDIETTGLYYEERDGRPADAILEVAMIATDDQLNELASINWITSEAQFRPFVSLNPFVREMHTKNGLWLMSLKSTLDTSVVARQCTDWVRDMIVDFGTVVDGKPEKPALAGSGVHFDRAFLRRDMPPVIDLLSYRNLDVSAFTETGRRFWPNAYAGRPAKPEENKVHRALDDVRESIDTLRYWLGSVVERPAITYVIERCGSDKGFV